MIGDNLRDTLTKVSGETKETPQPKVEETKEESTQVSAETDGGETAEKEYVSGVDISDIPPEQRPQIRQLLQKKAGLLEKGYQPKFQEVKNLKNVLEDLKNKGLTLDEAQKVIEDYSYKKRNPLTEEKAKAKKTLDALIDTVPVEQRESLKQLRQIITEETETSELKKQMEVLQNAVNFLSRGATNSRVTKINSDLDDLSKKYGEDLVNKYRDDIVTQGQKFDASTKQLLFAIVPSDELEQAILSKPNKKEEKLKAISSPGSGVSGTMETVDVKKTSLRDLIKLGAKR